VEPVGKVRDRGVTAPELLENAASGGICERGERGIEAGSSILNHTVQYMQKFRGMQVEAKRAPRLRPGIARRRLRQTAGLPDRETMTGMDNRYTGVFEQVGDWWTGHVEELPGCNVQERTLEEARASLKEVIQDILQANRELARREAEGHQVLREAVAVPIE